jgi:hypothetical protein
MKRIRVMEDESAPSQEVSNVSIPTEETTKSPLASGGPPKRLSILDNEETMNKVRRVLSARIIAHQTDRDDLADQWKDADFMWGCGVNNTKRSADQTDSTESDTGSTLFYKQARILAALDIKMMLSKPQSTPVKFNPTFIENVPFSMEDAEDISYQRNALLRYNMKKDNFMQKFINGDFMLVKYGNQPVMWQWRKRIAKRWVKSPKTDETGAITGFSWKKQDYIVDDHLELLLPPIENFYIDRNIGDLQDQQAIFWEHLEDISEINAGAVAGTYKNTHKIEVKHSHQGAGDNSNEGSDGTDMHTAHEENRGLTDSDDTDTGLFNVWTSYAKMPIDEKGNWDEKGTTPRWFVFEFVHNHMDGPALRAEETDDPDGQFPGFMWHRNPDDSDLAYHIADSTILKPNFDEATTRKNQYFDNLSVINRRPLVALKGAVHAKTLVYEQDKVIWVDQLDAVKEMSVLDTSQTMLSCLEYIDNDSNRAVGTDRPVSGEALGGRTSATEAENVRASAVAPHDVLIYYHMDQFLSKWGRAVQRYWETYGDSNRILAISDQKEIIRVDLNKIFGDFDTEVTIIQEYESDLVESQNMAFVMQSVIPNFLDVMGPGGKMALGAKILEKFKMDPSEIFPGFTDVDAEFVAQGRIEMMVTTGQYEAPLPGENTPAHLRVTEGYLLRWEGQADIPIEIEARLDLVRLYRDDLKQMAASAGEGPGQQLPAPPGNETPGEVLGNELAGQNPAANVGNIPITA